MFLRKAPKALLASKHSIPCLDIEIPATPNKEIKLHWRAAMVEEMNFHQNWYLVLPLEEKKMALFPTLRIGGKIYVHP